MLTLLLIGSMLLQQPSIRRPDPPQLPNHRHILTHEPRRQILSAEWWCHGSTRPSTVGFELRITQVQDATGRYIAPKMEVSLLTLTVSGERAPERYLREIRGRLAPLNNIGVLHGRCLHKPTGRAAPVIEFNGYINGTIEPQRIEFELQSE